MSDITRETRDCRAVLEFNLDAYNTRRPLYTPRYDTLGELLDVIKAFEDVPAVGTRITSVKIQKMTNGLFPTAGVWSQLEFSDWVDLKS